jgi:hypothetical protein
MKDNPKVAAMMMQRHGDIMRIWGEEMSKMGSRDAAIRRMPRKREYQVG